MADDCSWYDLVCSAKETVSETVSQGAQSGLQSLADGITAAAIKIVTTVGSMWVRTPTPALDGVETPVADPTPGTFNAQVDLILSYAAWIGLAVAVVATTVLGLVMAVNARRGDGAGFVNKTTAILGGTILISGATSLGSFIIPERSTNMAGSVAFLQDQTMYLTIGLAAVSLIIAGISMAWSHRAEPAQEVLKSLLILATVTVAGVTFISILTKGTDALAVQIVDAAIGEDFDKDVLRLLSLNPTRGSDPAWMGGSVILVIVGGLVAILVNLFQLALMALRTGMLFLLAGLLPLAASFTNTAKGKQFFEKTIGWTLAFAFYKPAAAAIYALAIKLTTSGLWEGDEGDPGILQFCAGLMMVIASIAALPVLIGFLSPMMSAMGSSGSSGAMGMAALGASIPGGASRMSRSGRGLGDNPIPSQSGQGSGKSNTAPTSGGASSGKGAASAGAESGAAKGAAASAATGAATAATGGAAAAASAVASGAKKGQEAVVSGTQAAAGDEAGSTAGSSDGTRARGNAVGGSGATKTQGSSHPGMADQERGGHQGSASGSRGHSSGSGRTHGSAGRHRTSPVSSQTHGEAGRGPGGANRTSGAAPSGNHGAPPKGAAPKSSGLDQITDGPEERGPRGADRN